MGPVSLSRTIVERVADDYDASYDKKVFSDRFRKPILERGFLTFDELAKIVEWKTKRQKTNVLKNHPETVEAVTRQAFQCPEPWLAVWTLSYLTAVRARVASAILTVYDPSRYTVIDVRAWMALEKLGLLEPLGLSDYGGIDTVNLDRPETYAAYLDACTRLAGELGVSLRVLDRCLRTLGPLDTQQLAAYGIGVAPVVARRQPA